MQNDFTKNAGDTRMIIKDNMLVDPALQQEIVRRVLAAAIGPQPDKAVHALGRITLPDGTEVGVFARHASDAILRDHFGHIAIITREFNPGAGLQALPGGFNDPVKGVDGGMVVEKAAKAALREASEETNISEEVLKDAEIVAVGTRSYDRPFDIRSAWGDIPGTDIKKGDLFIVSTQAFLIKTTQDLSAIGLKKGDDAADLQVMNVADLKADMFGIADHYPMIQAAEALYTAPAAAASRPQGPKPAR